MGVSVARGVFYACKVLPLIFKISPACFVGVVHLVHVHVALLVCHYVILAQRCLCCKSLCIGLWGILIVDVLNLSVVKYGCGPHNQYRSFTLHVKYWLGGCGFVGMSNDVGVS